MRYIGFLICICFINACQNEADNIIVWENDDYECQVNREIFEKRLDNSVLAKNNEGVLSKNLKQKMDASTKNAWILAKDEETKSLLENWRNRFYWDDNLSFIDKSTHQIVSSVREAQVHDLSGTLDLVIIESDTLFEARSVIN